MARGVLRILAPIILSWPLSVGAAPKLDQCPSAGEEHHYVETPAFPGQEGRSQKMRIHYFLPAPFDPNKPTMVFIDGGPGGYTVQSEVQPDPSYNSVYFHHRGLGCSQALFDFGSRFEEPVFQMAYAANDLDLIRKDLLGEKGTWFVYGRSYGSMLAQKYALLAPAGIEGLILDSTSYAASQGAVARRHFKDRYINEDPEIKARFEAAVSRFPDLESDILRVIFWVSTGGYKARVSYLPIVMKQIAEAADLSSAKTLIAQYDFQPPPLMGMSREIGCREIYDYPSEAEAQIFAIGLDLDCAASSVRLCCGAAQSERQNTHLGWHLRRGDSHRGDA